MAYTTVNNPSAYFTITSYTGNGNATQAITNSASAGNFKPDWVWLKSRSYNANHVSSDSTRGATKRLIPNLNNAEDSAALTSLDSNGFTTLSSGVWNNNNETYITWQWKANGGTTSTNSDGSQNSTVQVNSTAGFSIVKRTGTGSAGATYGHGLGGVPDVIINKGLNTNEWYSYFKAIGGGTHWMALDSTGAAADDANMWNDVNATSTVFTVGNSGGSNGNGVEYINYCFKEVKGYSKFGKYRGNGADDGPFVYTGFKPAFLMAKKFSGTGTWFIWDNKRTPFNVMNIRLLANTSAGDDTSNDNRIDFLSNGFKIRDNSTSFNDNNSSMFYMAFAENPLVASNDVIALAR